MRSALLTTGVYPLRSVGLALVIAGCAAIGAAAARADTTPAVTTPGATTSGTATSTASAPTGAKAGIAKTNAQSSTHASTSTPMKPYNPGSQARRSHLGDQWNTARFGIDEMHVRSVSSGSSIEFRYRVVDADKASVLTERTTTPYLIDQETGTRLDVPVMEKIGALRQTATPKVGREYWMVFANRTKTVKPGRRVDIFCGAFHIRGLTVE